MSSAPLLLALVPLAPQLADDRWACNADQVFDGIIDGEHAGLFLDVGNVDGPADPALEILIGGGFGASNPQHVARLLQDTPTPLSMCTEFGGITVNFPGEDWGSPVCIVGDVNGNGLPDLAIGEPMWNNGSGRVSIFYTEQLNPLCQTVTIGSANRVLEGQAGERFGWSLDSTDVDGDGVPDLVVGAPGCCSLSNCPSPGAGSAYVFRASTVLLDTTTYPNPVPSTAGLTPTSSLSVAADRFGFSVCGVGDVNGNGYEDFAVGAVQAYKTGKYQPWYSDPSGATGYVAVFEGRTLAELYTLQPPLSGTEQCGNFGSSIALATGALHPPVLLVGAPRYGYTHSSGPRIVTGGVYAFEAAGGLQIFAPPLHPIDPSSPGDPDPAFNLSLLGWSVAGGDWNQDGFTDAFAGAPQRYVALPTSPPPPCTPFTTTPDPAGWVLGWSGATLAPMAQYKPEPEGLRNHLGFALRLGDVDGDGDLDVVTSSPGHALLSNPGETGRVYVFLNP